MAMGLQNNNSRFVLEAGDDLDHAFFDSDNSDTFAQASFKENSIKNTSKVKESKSRPTSAESRASSRSSEANNEFSYKDDFNDTQVGDTPEHIPIRSPELGQDCKKDCSSVSETPEVSPILNKISSLSIKTSKDNSNRSKHNGQHPSTPDNKKIAEIIKLLSQFDKRFKKVNFRPKWCDPTSTKLPSDDLATIKDVLACYTETISNKHLKKSDPTSKVNRRSKSHNSILRRRENERIQTENFNIARRLQNVKPTRELCREQQLKAYMNLYNEEYPSIGVGNRSSRPSSSRTIRNNAEKNSFSSLSNLKWTDVVSNNYHLQCTNVNCCMSSRTSGKSSIREAETAISSKKVDYPVVVVPHLPPMIPSRKKK